MRRGKLGKLPAKHDSRTLRVAQYLHKLPAPRPDGVDWEAAVRKAHVQLGMLGNDQYGDCFWAMAAHSFMTWNANAGRVVNFTTDGVLAAYSAATGFNPSDPNSDTGTVMLDGLKFLRSTGMTDASGKVHKIGAFAAVDPKNPDEVRVALDIFGELLIGVEFPADWMNANVWDVNSSSIEGGHAINGVARDLKSAPTSGINIDTWGTDDRWITWAALCQNCDELYVTIPPDWLEDNGKAPNGLDIQALTTDLAAITA